MKKFAAILFLLLSLVIPTVTYAQVTNDISVNAAVNPHPSDFQLSINTDPTSATVVNQFQNIVYTITYGSHLSYAAPITITASWDDGTIEGQSSPSMSIADYVVGSASNAYNNTPAIVDTVHKNITWTITSLPANTLNRTVTFTLQTNISYTGTPTVTFPTTTDLTVSGTTVPDQSVTMTYQYNPAITPSPTPHLTPSPSTTVAPTTITHPTSATVMTTIIPTITPTPSQSPFFPFTITKVSVETVSPTNATIHVTTDSPATISLQSGTSLQSINQNASEVAGIDQIIPITNLQAHTQYYFRVLAKFGTKSVTSEIFTFTTANAAPTIQIDKNSLIVTSDTTLVYSVEENINGQLHETIVLPINKPFQFTFSIAGQNNVKKIEAFIQHTKVLGVNTFDSQPAENNITLFEIQPHVYQGMFLSSSSLGIYGLYIRTYDTKGNLDEKQLFSIKVTHPLILLNTQTKKPIRNAQVILYRLDLPTHAFIKITPQMFAVQNPSFSNPKGEISFVLPQGTYQAVVSAFGYRNRTVAFRIGAAPGEEYPNVYLDESVLNISNVQDSFQAGFTEIMTATNLFGTVLENSEQFSIVLCAITVVLFSLLSLIALSFRLHTNIFLLPWLLGYRLQQLIFKRKHNVLCRVIDATSAFPLKYATITIIDADSNAILYTGKTNPAGEYSFFPTDCNTYKIAVEKIGYEQHPFFEFLKESLFSGILLLPIKREDQAISLGMYISAYIRELISLSLEVVLVTTLLLELLFSMYMGWSSILPFFFLSLLNFALLSLTLHSYKYCK